MALDQYATWIQTAILAVILSAHGILQAEEENYRFLPLASTEAESSSIVAGCVNAITGHYFECSQDLVVAGAEPLTLGRTYFGMTTYLTDMQHCWQHNHEGSVVLWKAGKEMVARCTEPSTSTTFYKEGATKGNIRQFSFNLSVNKRGLTNCGSAVISGQTNLKNHKVHLEKSKNVVSFASGAGCLRNYREHPKVKSGLYQLESEFRPSGNSFKYVYGQEGLLNLVRAVSKNNQTSFGSLEFKTLNKKDLEKSPSLEVIASDGRRVKYSFEKIVPTSHEKKYYNASERFVLNKVERPKYTVRYEYQKLFGFYDILKKKIEPDGRYLEIDYYLTDTQKTLNGKVRELRAPVGNDATPVVTHRFTYSHSTNEYGTFLGPSFTTVSDALNCKTRYHFSKEERLTAIERFKADGQLCFRERLIWGGENTADCANLVSRILENSEGVPVKCTEYHYDSLGNVTEERLYGNLTGQNQTSLQIGNTGRPLQNGCEFQKVTHTYADVTRNYLMTRSDSKKKELYNYSSGTNLVSGLWTFVDNQIVRREFNDYDDNGVNIRKIIDDGSTYEAHNLASVTERHITLTTPRISAPVGLPEVVEERYLDLSTCTECLLKKVVNKHSPEGWLLKQDVYDSNNNYAYSLEWEYDLQGNVISEKNALGYTTTREFDDNGNLKYEQTPRLDMHKKFHYDYSNRLIREDEIYTDGRKLSIQHRYDFLGQKTATVDFFGNETTYAYDEMGRIISTTTPPTPDASGGLTTSMISTTYDVMGNVTSITDGRGNTTTTLHTVFGKPYQICHPDGAVESFTYDTDGVLLKSVAKNGSYTHYEHDYKQRCTAKRIYSASGELLSQTFATYNAFHLVSEVDAAGKTTTYKYDGAGRKTYESKNDSETLYVYDALGREIECHEKFGESPNDYVIKVRDYDLLDQMIEETIQDPFQNVYQKKSYRYDEVGNRKAVETYSDLGIGVETTEYDAHNRPVKVTDALGNVTITTYDYNYYNAYGQNVGYQETVDSLGNSTITISDAVGHVAMNMRTNSLGEIIQKREFFYDKSGNKCRLVESIITPNAEQRQVCTEWTYDGCNRIRELVEAQGTTEEKHTEYTYNAAGEKEKIIKADGVVLHHIYDGLGRLQNLSSSDGTVDYTYTYDRLNNPIQVDDAIHQLSTIKAYDKNNRMFSETLGNGLTIHYSYDRLGRPTRIELPDGTFQETVYRSTQIAEMRRLNKEGNVVYSHRYLRHDLSGNIMESQLAVQERILQNSYDLLGRCCEIKAPGWNESIKYDAVGNIKKRILVDIQGSFECLYTHDDLYQLRTESGIASHEYQHDSLYNRTVKDAKPSKFNALNQLLTDVDSTYRYDLNGNMRKQKGEQQLICTYDALDRLIAVKTPQETFTYLYDSENRRLSKSYSLGQTERYFYIGSCEIGACDAMGKIAEYRFLGQGKGAEIGAAVAIELQGTLYIPLHDAQGSVVTLLDSTGKVSSNYHYSAFGEETAYGSVANDNPWRFSSKRHDAETGFIYFGRRYYSPSTGRWVTPDPIGYDGGPNLYCYVLNAPLNHFDLYGLFDERAPPNAGPHSGMPQNTSKVLDLIFRSIFLPANSSKQESKIAYNQTFLNSSMNRGKVTIGYDGMKVRSDRGMGFTNGINTTRLQAARYNRMLSDMSGGYKSDLVYNPTVNPVSDACRYLCSSRSYMATPVLPKLHQNWDKFFENSSPNSLYLQFCQSEGATNVRNAIMSYDEQRRQRIDIVVIAPSVYIDDDYGGKVRHYASARDFIPNIDKAGKMRNAHTTQVLEPHKDAPYHDHGMLSPTFQKPCFDHIKAHYHPSNDVRR